MKDTKENRILFREWLRGFLVTVFKFGPKSEQVGAYQSAFEDIIFERKNKFDN